MDQVTMEAPASADPGPPAAPLSVWGRAAAIFLNPNGAWAGVEARRRWWFPILVMVLVNGVFAVALHERALLPMITEGWEEQVEAGRITPEQLERMEAGFAGPVGRAMSAVQQAVVWPLMMLVLGLGVWFGVGFVLGTKLRFRHAFEIVSWASLVLIPSYFVTGVLAWAKETLRGIHLGLGALVPMSDRPERLQVGLATLLDAIGPFGLWYLVVVVLGASIVSGAPRRSVAWVLGGLYALLSVFMAAMAALFTPGA